MEFIFSIFFAIQTWVFRPFLSIAFHFTQLNTATEIFGE